MKKILKILLIVIVILVFFMVGVIGGFFLILQSKLNKINYVDIPKSRIEITSGVEEMLSGYRNIVLFGIDDADGFVGRSDCIIIFSLNEETKDVKMTSIYRDTYVEVPEHGYTKINHAYAYGGAALAMSTINRNLDLDIKQFVTINFEVVKDVVDYVGGVELYITSAEASRIPDITGEGTYNLNGRQALAYGRIRKIDSDYKRTDRMRKVIDAVFTKVKKMSVAEINEFTDIIFPEVQTNIQKKEITSMLTELSSISIKGSMGWPYNVEGKMLDGVWYGVPVTLQSSVQRLHEDIFEDKDYTTTETVNNISSNITKKTGIK